jgi:serine/threonine-protein kinase
MRAAIERHIERNFQDEVDAQERVIEAALRRASRPTDKVRGVKDAIIAVQGDGAVSTVPRVHSVERAPELILPAIDEPRFVRELQIPQLLGGRLHKLPEFDDVRATVPPTPVNAPVQMGPPLEATTEDLPEVLPSVSEPTQAAKPPSRPSDTVQVSIAAIERDRTPLVKKKSARPPARSSEPMASNPPRAKAEARRVARYELQGELGFSGSTLTIKAKDPNVARFVVLKLLDPSKKEDEQVEALLPPKGQVMLLQREARLAGRLSHPSLPVLFDAGRDGGLYFLAYEFVEGELLSTLLSKGKIETSSIRLVLRDLLDVLGYLHGEGVAHGDLRASNVLVGVDGRTRLLDLSMAAIAGEPDHPLRSLNAPCFSPELLRGESYGPSSDQFTLGMLLYRMISGQQPFDGRTAAELSAAISSSEPRPPEALVSGADGRLSEVAMRLLEKDPTLRFKDLGLLIEFLEDPGLRRTSLPVVGARSTVPPPRAPASPDRAVRTMLIEPVAEPTELERVLKRQGMDLAVCPSPAEALANLPACPEVNAVLLSEDVVIDAGVFRRELQEVAPIAELRIVPRLEQRITGPLLDAEDLALALADLLSRTVSVRGKGERGGREEPWAIARAVARRLALGPRAELIVAIASSARDLAWRLRLSSSSDEIASAVPQEVLALWAPIEAVLAERIEIGAPKPSRAAQVVAVVERFLELTKGADEGQRKSPRKAIQDLRRAADARRVSFDVVEALIDELRDLISALDVPPRAKPKRRLLLAAGAAAAEELTTQLLSAGYDLERSVDGEEAWAKLNQDSFDAVVASIGQTTKGSLPLVRLLRTDPRFLRLPLVVLVESNDDTMDDEIHPGPKTEVIERSAPRDAVTRAVGRVMEA